MVFAAKPATPLAPASLARPEATPAPSFERVYDECFAMVWRGLHRLGVPEALVDDATQDVFLKVHCHLHGFEGRSSVRSWVFGIAVNVAREHRRRARRGPEVLPQLPDLEGGGDPFQSLACHEALRVLDHLLATLAPDRREVLVLADWEDMTVPEIAAALDVNVNTAYSRLRAARADFNAALARHRGGLG